MIKMVTALSQPIRAKSVRVVPALPVSSKSWTCNQRTAWQLWQEWRKTFRGPRLPYERLPIAGYRLNASEVIPQLKESLLPGCRCLIVECWPQESHLLTDDFKRQLVASLEEHPSLKEVQFQVIGRTQAVDTPPFEVNKVLVRKFWDQRSSYPSLPDYLRQLRERAGLSRRDAAETVHLNTGRKFKTDQLSRLEDGVDTLRAFPLFVGLAAVYEEDVRDVIAAANLSQYAEMDPRCWTTEFYPGLIDTRSEQLKISLYDTRSPKTAAWRIHMGRKDPWRYCDMETFGESLGIHSTGIVEVEASHYPPNASFLLGACEFFGRPASYLAEPVCGEFFGEVPVSEIFGPHWVWIDTHSDEAWELSSFRDSPTIGGFICAARKLKFPFESPEEASVEIGRDAHYMRGREREVFQVKAANLSDWVWIYKTLGIPLEVLRALLPDYGIDPQSPACLLAEAMDGQKLLDLKAAGVDNNFLHKLVGKKDFSPDPRSFLELKRVLPTLRVDQLLGRYFPEVGTFFKEARGESPVLQLTEAEVRQSLEFDLGERLVAFRLDPPAKFRHLAGEDGTLDLQTAAKCLGIDHHDFSYQEHCFARVRGVEKLKSLPQALGVSPKIFYLSQVPEILGLFPVSHRLDAAGHPRPYAHKEFRDLMHPVIVRRESEEKTVDRIKRVGRNRLRRGVVAFFLGRKADGTIDFSLPQGETRASFSKKDFRKVVEGSLRGKRLSRTETLQVERILKNQEVTANDLMFLSRKTHLPRRNLFLLAKKNELK